jgi:plasmid segregation protein ParM
MLTVAVDVGFGHVKGLSNDGAQVNFPSVIGEFRPTILNTNSDNVTLQRHFAIEYNNERRFIGETALKQSIPLATVDRERTIRDEGIMLLMAALSQLVPGYSSSIRLVVGLPVAHYDSMKNQYIEAVRGKHLIKILDPVGQELGLKSISVEDVQVLPQPVGTYFHWLFNGSDVIDNHESDDKIGIIDIGYNTVDIVRVQDGDTISYLSDSFQGLGIYGAFYSFAREINRLFGIELKPEEIEPIFRNDSLKINGQFRSIEPYKKSVLEETAGQIISRIKSLWHDRQIIDRIIITGGGACLLGKYLTPEFGEISHVIDNPVFANVFGYIEFGKRIWKQ